MIIGVAAKVGELVIALPKPNRHGDCFRHIRTLGLSKEVELEFGLAKNQGFYDENGKYYSRPQAARHAFECGQLDYDRGYCSEEYW